MKHYQHLTLEERYQIQALLKAKHKQSYIALILGVSEGSLSREIARNSGHDGYQAREAQCFADARKSKQHRTRVAKGTWRNVDRLLKLDWIPEQISSWLTSQDRETISHEWIYQYVYRNKKNGGDLHVHLRHQNSYRKRGGTNDRRGQIKDRVSIDDRPAIVDEKSRVGDWEADTVIGTQGCPVLVTLVERKTRFTLMALSKDKSAGNVQKALLEAFSSINVSVHTITYDNGKEFAYHKQISQALKSEAFFAHPYHSWERGLNENTNGLIRQYLPKGTNFKNISDTRVKIIQDQLNNRPRKCIEFKTPNQLMLGVKPVVALAS